MRLLRRNRAAGRVNRIVWRTHFGLLFQPRAPGRVRRLFALALGVGQLRKELCQLRTHSLKRKMF
jgi:hypothetical protein